MIHALGEITHSVLSTVPGTWQSFRRSRGSCLWGDGCGDAHLHKGGTWAACATGQALYNLAGKDPRARLPGFEPWLFHPSVALGNMLNLSVSLPVKWT